MVKTSVDWYKSHREVLEGDLVHLRRADGKDLDYWLNVNPAGEEKGLLVVFNPLDQAVTKTITVPLYYTGVEKTASISQEDGSFTEYELDRQERVRLEVSIPAHGQSWFVIQ